MDVKSLRKDYPSQPFGKRTAAGDPFDQFHRWFDEAVAVETSEPNAMVLATATKEGVPSTRTMLLKELDDAGLVFFTNYESRKGKELTENPYASVTFCWHALTRQVVVDGAVEKISVEESQAYFATRPRNSQLGAWASQQDTPLESRKVLEEAFAAAEERYGEDKEIPCPPYWGGYRLVPKRFEFWQGRPDRLHDRLCYTKQASGWHLQRLSP